jgi:hypothetical protein
MGFVDLEISSVNFTDTFIRPITRSSCEKYNYRPLAGIEERASPVRNRRAAGSIPARDSIYRVYKKKLHIFEIALKFAKQLLVSSF